ncbi:MAG: DnaB-like helicase C-terminal domain-containing protein [Desulforhopalus sp.]
MARNSDPISDFYLKHLGGELRDTISVDCPFCVERGFDGTNRLSVVLNHTSFFRGYFRCLNRCVPGGYPLWFARLAAIPLHKVPEYDPDLDMTTLQVEFPVENINSEVQAYQDRITDNVYEHFNTHGISRLVLKEMGIGFNGRYIVYPYLQEDGNCYAARCVHPETYDDYFWHGDEKFSREPFNLFNIEDINRCENGALFICEGEENLLVLKQLGFPGVAVSHYTGLEKLSAGLLENIRTVFICTANSQESDTAARNLASRLGYKARILAWPGHASKRYDLCQLARDAGKSFTEKIGEMVRNSRAFSPFSSPAREFTLFEHSLQREQGEEYSSLSSGFPLYDAALGGVHGINVIGGAPKVGKSTFMIQIASEMALKKIPVLYYDFENGRQKIYQRTLCRLARVSAGQLRDHGLLDDQTGKYSETAEALKSMLFYWRVVNDRTITPELMRKHIDFIRHETRSEYTVVIIDSLHKLPFNEFSEQRTGIDAWLRQMESIRDEMQVSFLVISELSRDAGGSYRETPHLGIFKGSGDIEYSADNAMVLYPKETAIRENQGSKEAGNTLWLVASREHSPGRVADYHLDYPYWGFTEEAIVEEQPFSF